MVELTEVRARMRLRMMTDYTGEPALSDDELAELLETAKRPDRYGLAPTDTGWTPTWDLNAAAADGWDVKAGKCASEHYFAADGAMYTRNQIHDHCVAMAARYRAKVTMRGTVQTEADRLGILDVDVIGN